MKHGAFNQSVAAAVAVLMAGPVIASGGASGGGGAMHGQGGGMGLVRAQRLLSHQRAVALIGGVRSPAPETD